MNKKIKLNEKIQFVNKKIKSKLKARLPIGKINPGTVGPILAPHGIKGKEFCDRFNKMETLIPKGETVIVKILLAIDGSYEIILPKAIAISKIILKVMNMEKGSDAPGKNIVATITREQCEEVIKLKQDDLFAFDIENQISMVKGTARSMGIKADF